MRDLNFISSPLGFSPYVPARKEWVMEALAGAGLASSVLSSFLGGGAASKAAKEQRDMLKAQKAADDAGFMYKKYVPYVETAEGQRLVNRAKSVYDQSIERTQGAAKVAGGTDASVQMAKDSANKAYGDMVADIAANDTARQDMADREKRANDRAYTQQMAGIEAQRAQSITDAAQGMSNAMMSAAGALAQGNSTNTNLEGSVNNSAPNVKVAPPKLDTTSLSNMKSSHTNLMNDLEKERQSVLNGGIGLS